MAGSLGAVMLIGAALLFALLRRAAWAAAAVATVVVAFASTVLLLVELGARLNFVVALVLLLGVMLSWEYTAHFVARLAAITIKRHNYIGPYFVSRLAAGGEAIPMLDHNYMGPFTMYRHKHSATTI